MDMYLKPGKLSGSVTPPASKSMAHRVMLAAMLCSDPCEISCFDDSQDLQATARCIKALQNAAPDTLALLDCGESGSTLRFLIPVALAVNGGGRFTGHGRLMERPQQPYLDLFAKKGVVCSLENNILTVQGTLCAGEYSLPGHVSSQFVTGLLYALPLLSGNSVLRMETPLESRGYVDLTLEVLARFGICVENHNYEWFAIPGGQHYRAQTATVEADWSQAAFWYAANFLDNHLQIEGLNPRSVQGDMIISELYWKLARPGTVEIDVSDCPDLLPPLAVMAAVRSGSARFTGAARLRLKESDRLATTAAMLRALGGSVEEFPDALLVHGQETLAGGSVDGANDHRIVMAAAIAATACTSSVTITGAEAVQKSYPTFWETYLALGGDAHVL